MRQLFFVCRGSHVASPFQDMFDFSDIIKRWNHFSGAGAPRGAPTHFWRITSHYLLTVNSISYKKMYFMTKMTARQYMRREIFSRLPVSRLMTTYEMMPKEMPSEML